jgi:AcrR family transcriptional regulator
VRFDNPMPERPEPARRRRRRPEEARAEILAAARGLLERRPAHEVTVGAIMAATTLSRKAFYVYFRDRFDLLSRLVDPLRVERDAIVAELFARDDPAAGGRAALVALARLYADHGAVLRALAEASSQDSEARRAWKEFIEPVIAGHAEWIRREIAAGRVSGLDPEPTARALIGMNLQFFFDRLLDEPHAGVEETADTLLVLWTRALYGVAPGMEDSGE